MLWLLLSLTAMADGVIPLGLPSPVPFPADNPPSAEKIALGRELFFDQRLSRDGTVACASCHIPAQAWTDGRARARGIRGQVGELNVPVLFNRAYGKAQFWDGRVKTLEGQIVFPLTHPAEMGSVVEEVITKLNAITGYRAQFVKVFGHAADAESLYRALAAFERTILSGDSPYDRYQAGELRALTAPALRGKDLFFKKFRCDTCHSGPLFSNEEVSPRCYPQFAVHDPQAESLHEEPREHPGKFKTPTLRNIALTGPYFHDGALTTLEQVLDFYNDSGPLPKNFVDRKDFPVVHMTRDERGDLIAFLKSLTGKLPDIRPPQLPQ